jgi:ABC-2 type transport system permease protein
MARITASEWRKLRATPTVWWLLVAMVVATAIGTVLAFMVDELRDVVPNTGSGLKEGLHPVGTASILAMVAGIIGMAGEFRFHQADQTFLSTPRRGRVLAAKVVVLGSLGALFAIVSAAVVLTTAWTWLTVKGFGLPFGEPLIWQTFGGSIASASLMAILGVAVGAVLRNQVIAIVLMLGVQNVLEGSLYAASSNVGRWLASLAGNGLRLFPADGLLSPGTAAIVLAGWAAVALVIGFARIRRNDIT